MQQQQQQQGGNPPYGSPSFAAFAAAPTVPSVSPIPSIPSGSDLGAAEEASPLSSRPPAATPFDGDGGNRWPRQETLALLQIRSDMDGIFRDATLKGPLWEDVSRKLGDQGFKRSAKKCKEKFENVHKYYKRTKEGRAGRQDGKSYRFFTQLEALHNTISTPTSTSIQHILPNLSSPMSNIPISSVRASTPLVTSTTQMPQQFGVFNPPVGVSFSSDSEMESSGSDELDGEDELDLEPDMMDAEPSNRKRKRGSSSSSSGKMMVFFEGLMKQVMLKQEALQQKFLEAVEKREQDRMIREEAWKRQEVARLAREHELMVQERNISASRDAAIISFLQKITGQTIQLPTVPPVAPPQPQPPPPPPPQVSVQQTPQQTSNPNPPTELFQKLPVQQPPPPQQQQQNTTGVVVAVPEQQVAPVEMSGGGMEGATSSRWPKPEVLALIKLRSGLEPRYQEAGPKGPLWEEISAGMHGLGYKRNPKRCKEKWENINKYFKKVKESNKKRPEDAKTCPYFHELDALYRKKILGGTPPAIGGVGSSSGQLLLQQPPEPQQQQQQQQQQMSDHIQQIIPSVQVTQPEINVPTSNGDLTATLFGEGSDGGIGGGVAKKPEDILKEQQHENRQNLTMNDFNHHEQDNDINLDQDQDDEYDDDDDDDDDDDGDEEAQEEMKMAYKIQFQRPNTANGSSSNGSGSGNGTTSFLAMVQ